VSVPPASIVMLLTTISPSTVIALLPDSSVLMVRSAVGAMMPCPCAAGPAMMMSFQG
jgi:hypothetical protein